jgi:hypothetical protein
MPGIKFTIFAFVVIFSMFGPTVSIAANDYGDDDDSYTPGPEDRGPPEFIPPPGSSEEPDTNDSIVDGLEAATKYCELLLPKAYVIDCLSERLGALAKQLQGQKEFAEVQAILETTSKKLNRIAVENRSTTLPSANFSTPGAKPGAPKIPTTRRLIPVDDAKIEEALAEALVVIEEAETLLLRSAGDPSNRTIEFQRIAAALGSNKVLLRSS